jgi:hypothetical protein
LTTTEARPQTSIYETEIDNDELEKVLEDREKAKAARGDAQKAYKDADDQAKALIRSLDIADAPVRVGRFVVSERQVAGKTVSFETQPTTRVQISLLDEAA